MSDLEKHLLDEHKKVLEELGSNPHLNLSFSDGDPPKKYEVEYKIKGGVKQGDGSVQAEDLHRVSILLPFGYPNFPPNCKPLTSIFHPNFDPAAICISHYWQESQSLPGLILYIGKMISGQIYILDNAFNPEAAQWYADNPNQLPFDSVELDTVPSVGLDSSRMPEPDKTDDVLELILEESELPAVEEIDSIHGEQLSVENSPEKAATAPGGEQVPHPEPAQEHTVPSVPPEDISPLETLDTVGQAEQQMDEEEEDREALLAKAYVDEEAQRRKKRLIASIAGGVGVIVFVGGYLLAGDILKYNSAQKLWTDIQPLLQRGQYSVVQTRGEKALKELTAVRFLKREETAELTKNINALLQSEEFLGRLAGKVLYQGQYVIESTIPVREGIHTAIGKGDAALVADEGETALLMYLEAQKLAESIKLKESDLIGRIERSIARSRLQLLVEKGEVDLENGRLDKAVTSFQKAAELVNQGVEVDPDKRVFIHQSLDKALLRKFIKEGEGAFTLIELDKALNSFNQALLLAEKEASAAPEFADKIRQSIQQIKLYQLLEAGKVEYESRQWEKALKSFQNALEVIQDGTFGQTEMSANEKAIKKKILQIAVRMSEDRALASRQSGKLLDAVNEENRSIALIQQSPFKNEKDMLAKLAALQKDVQLLNQEFEIKEKSIYLTENYEQIFKENHLLARSASLRDPRVFFIKREGQRLVFSLNCSGFTSTGKITLELNYQFDKARQAWSLYKKR